MYVEQLVLGRDASMVLDKCTGEYDSYVVPNFCLFPRVPTPLRSPSSDGNRTIRVCINCRPDSRGFLSGAPGLDQTP